MVVAALADQALLGDGVIGFRELARRLWLGGSGCEGPGGRGRAWVVGGVDGCLWRERIRYVGLL